MISPVPVSQADPKGYHDKPRRLLRAWKNSLTPGKRLKLMQ